MIMEVLMEFSFSVQNVKIPEFSVHVLYNSFTSCGKRIWRKRAYHVFISCGYQMYYSVLKSLLHYDEYAELLCSGLPSNIGFQSIFKFGFTKGSTQNIPSFLTLSNSRTFRYGVWDHCVSNTYKIYSSFLQVK